MLHRLEIRYIGTTIFEYPCIVREKQHIQIWWLTCSERSTDLQKILQEYRICGLFYVEQKTLNSNRDIKFKLSIHDIYAKTQAHLEAFLNQSVNQWTNPKENNIWNKASSSALEAFQINQWTIPEGKTKKFKTKLSWKLFRKLMNAIQRFTS